MVSGSDLPPGLLDEEEEGIPPGFKVLFGAGVDLTLITETPKRMIVPLVTLRVINAAYDPNRKVPLDEIFITEFDRRMVSKDREGRGEALELFQGLLRRELEEEQASA